MDDKEKTAVYQKFEESEWQCHLFSSYRGGEIPHLIYRPYKGQVPNWFVRWMMRICFDCVWEKKKR